MRQTGPRSWVIDPHHRFDEGKGGPWIKLTWRQATLLEQVIRDAKVENDLTFAVCDVDDLNDILQQLGEQQRHH